MNATELLIEDHDRVEELFKQVKENEDGDNTAVFQQIKDELDAHTHIEETIFYPKLIAEGDKELKKRLCWKESKNIAKQKCFCTNWLI